LKAAEAQKPPATIEASAGETCAERVVQAAAALAEEDYTTALGLLLGDERVEAAKDGQGNAMVVGPTRDPLYFEQPFSNRLDQMIDHGQCEHTLFRQFDSCIHAFMMDWLWR